MNLQLLKKPWPLIGSILSGLLLVASFPPLEWSAAAWIALVPLMLAARAVAPRRALALGFLAGVVFWICSINWLRYVTAPGWIGLSLYCALYTMPPAVLFSWWGRRWGTTGGSTNLALIMAVSIVWVASEYVRSVLLTGFPWNPLGASQYGNLLIIQNARWGGVYAVSALVVWMNAAIALTILRYAGQQRRSGWVPHPEVLSALLVILFALGLGGQVLFREKVETRPLRVALVQPNIPQSYYYIPELFTDIYDRLRELTEAAVHASKADLVIWPETAIPNDVRNSEPDYQLVQDLLTNRVPMLVGTMDTEWLDEGHPLFFNSSMLFDRDGRIVEIYDKRHLVMFGEYVPLRRIFPFLKQVTPIEESFTAGSTSTVFRLENPAVAFSVLICFEDTVMSLARESVRNGARLLINQTNDAWFDPSAESRQHMIQCVFRSVENGVPAIRCTNTGVTGCIDRLGRIYDVLDDGRGHVRVTGFRASQVDVPGSDMPQTFYTRHGDVFAQACAIMGLLMLPGIYFVRARKDPFDPAE